jgi:hypothetical protein
MFINFLLNLLDLAGDPNASQYYDWYIGAGAVMGVIVPVVVSLVFVTVFYYLWSRVKATTTFHWLLMGLINAVVTFFVTLFMGRSFLANYAESLGDDNLWYYITTWPFPVDLWVYAVNGVIWSFVFYFVLSCILKTWSNSYNVPFGKSHKKIKKA